MQPSLHYRKQAEDQTSQKDASVTASLYPQSGQVPSAQQLHELTQAMERVDQQLQQESAKRQELERLYAEQQAFEGLLSEISARFVHILAENVHEEIEDVQRLVCRTLGFDRSTLWQFSQGGQASLSLTHIYQSGAFPPFSNIPDARVGFPWTFQQVMARKTVAVGKLTDLPPEAGLDRKHWEQYSTKSSLVMPLCADGDRVLGALTFVRMTHEGTWPPNLVARLELISQIFARALDRKRSQTALLRSEAQLRVAAICADVGLWSLDLERQHFWASAKLGQILHLTPDEPLTLDRFLESIPGHDRQRVRQAFCGAPKDNGTLWIEHQVLWPDGTIRWILTRGSLDKTGLAASPQLMGASVDITERKKIETELVLSLDRFQHVAEVVSDFVWEVDVSGQFTYTSPAVTRILGYLPEELVRKLRFFDLFLPEERSAQKDLLFKAFESHQPFRALATANLSKGGKLVYLEVSGAPLLDSAGSLLGYRGASTDFTERKQAQDALAASYAEIQELKNRLQAESEYLKAEIKGTQVQGEVTGRSNAIQQVMGHVAQVAPTDSTVLITGETGTGKERIAAEIHRRSARGRHVMVTVNCAALPSTLVESELFGREKGAYTGALTNQVGRFEVADGSTIFLDEIGELSLEIQAKLLRVLQEGQFERLGSPRTHKVNVRVIAATNRDLPKLVNDGRFRKDLFYRLNVFPIQMPPLRERAEDIPLLSFAFLEEFSTRMGRKVSKIPRKTMDSLMEYSWPGNIRELRNVIEHGVICSSGDTLRVLNLIEAPSPGRPPVTLAESERAHILRTLQRTGWRIKGPRGAARLLGLNPATLYFRMKKHGIPSRDKMDEMPT